MVSTVTPKPNHYERLGLAPDAGAEEIARAFATAMSPLMPRSVTDLVEIALAFETLRNPTKRRAYDASIAPVPEEPQPEAAKDCEAKLMFPREGWPITPSARIGSVELPVIHALPRTARKVQPTPSIAPSPKVEVQPAPEPRSNYQPDAIDRLNAVEQASAEWGRPAAMVGALFAGVAVMGAGLGWYASRGIAPAQAEDVLAVPMPGAGAPVAEPPAPPPAATKPIPQHRSRPAAAPARRATPASEAIPSVEKRADDVPDIPSEQVAALTSQAADAPGTMPLPDAIVARTIRKIGYACAEVASTTAVDSAPGVFKVTCTSGESYKATPVRGRYHFRRWAGN